MAAQQNTKPAPITEVHVSFSTVAIAAIDLTAGRISEIHVSTEVSQYDCDVLRFVDRDGRTFRPDPDNPTHQAAWATAQPIIETDTGSDTAELVRSRVDQMIQDEPERQRESPSQHCTQPPRRG